MTDTQQKFTLVCRIRSYLVGPDDALVPHRYADLLVFKRNPDGREVHLLRGTMLVALAERIVETFAAGGATTERETLRLTPVTAAMLLGTSE